MKFTEYKGLDLPKTAEEVLKFWEEQAIFEKSITSREGKEPFVFYEGPPSANGLPGIHHVMARAIKDIFCRYKTQKGFQVKRKAGWDTHGLPVELGVEKELGITKEDIGTKISVEEYNEACKKAVMRYTDIWNDMTRKIGYWVDMEDPYITYKPKYMESVWWLLKQIYTKDLMYKGYTIQPYSPKAGTGLSSHEINQPGAYQDVTDTTIVAQFKAKEETLPEFLKGFGTVHFLAWTTTPWTLPSNTALTVGPKIDYVLVKTFNQYTFEPINVVVAKPLLKKQFSGKYFEATSEEDFTNYTSAAKKIPFQVIAEGKGAAMVGAEYEQLLTYALPYQNPENAFRVISGDFVTTEDGTGIVHTAPTFGADDAKVAKEATPEIPPMLVLDENDNPVPLVDLQGRFRAELPEIGGKYVKNEYYADGEAPEKSVDVEIAIKLKEENKAFKVEKYVHSYPHCWRTDKPVLYYPLDSWFIKVTEVKDRMYELNKTINWKPKATGEGRFGNWLQNANDWNLSRSRFWGIPLPIWRTEDGKEEVVIGSIEELKAEMAKAVEAGVLEADIFADFEVGNMSEDNYNKVDLHKNVVDKITLVAPSGKPMKREADLIDVWFDSGSMPYAQWHYPFEAPSNSPQGGEKVSPKYETARNSSYKLLKQLKEEGKKHSTDAEKILWESLRTKKLEGFKFRREHIIDEFIVDFVCLSQRLIVEVDGGYHSQPEIQQADALRTEILEDLGYKVIRFANEEVIGDIDTVLSKIAKELKSPLLGRGLGGGFFPADYIAEGVDQTRGWFYTLHAIGTMVFDSVAYKNVVSNGLVLDKNGQKMSKRLGNAVDPFKTLDEYGPDATRWYMISNANPWDNLKFDLEGIAEVRRKFFGTLYNTYSFFSLYANIDGFTYAEDDIPLNERPEIDRWILSELNTLIQKVDEAYAEYEPTRAARAVSEFVQENLSNWYVRLCRRRFWKGEYEKDKISAYQTLYTCLETVAKLGAPIAPFYMDQLYKDLVSTTNKENYESVHLAEFPQFVENFVDKLLERKMEKAQTISSLVLSLRKKEMIKVRQPLQRVMIPILDEAQRDEIKGVEELIKSEVNVKEIELIDDASGLLVKQIKPNFKVLGPRFGKDMKLIVNEVDKFEQSHIQEIERNGEILMEINGKNITLGIDEVEISSQDIEGWLVASSGAITVALDVTITDDLRNEGVARELVNRIQNLRKDSGFDVTDKIDVRLQKDGFIEKAVENNIEYIKAETLTAQLNFEENLDNGTEIAFDEVNTRLIIQKH
ncbi:isoleucyl-tRNA synthetase [Galbibacter orientalis DSM 19592]|uniref:Isoleucine--tRNA ligase n=1 Tax=Galbibacter orientalis DSM 19592 TaxID=926559 RepID=I3C339_9FLAO|nr:isoleucine--tRNA ligase [Galbibacter orientalis]EIJ38032.1 isoleucyl-tRNA synthetase [Galbibacter orientalis DSM 19592]